MGKELRAGISVSGTKAHFTVLEVHDQSAELRHIEEIHREKEDPVWFLHAITSLDRKLAGKIARTSIALDSGALHLHSFPMDTTLSPAEQNEQVHWEFSRYVAGFQQGDYLNDLHVLRSNAKEQVADVLAVAVKRSLVSEIETYLESHKLSLGIVDVGNFAAEFALLSSHPEIKTKQSAIVSLTAERFEIAVLSNDRLVDYRYGMMGAMGETVAAICESAREHEVSALFLHGEAVSFEWQKALRAAAGGTVMALNPFRRVRIPSSVTNFGKFIGREHRFAAAVGAALRT